MGKHTKGRRLITEKEIELMKAIWPNSTLQEVKDAFPYRSVPTLYVMAKQAGVSVEYRQRVGDMSRLLDASKEAWYWLGFILADGHMNKQGQLSVMLSDKDEEHLQKFADFVSARVRRPYSKEGKVYQNRSHFSSDPDKAARSMVRVTLRNVDVAPKLNDLLGLTDSNKTQHPPTKLDELSQDALECLFVGFFDGDGARCGRLECHSSWLPVFEIFQKRGLLQTVAINKNGYVKGHVKKITRKRLRLDHDVPLLSRKCSD